MTMRIRNNTNHYIRVFSEIAEKLMPVGVISREKQIEVTYQRILQKQRRENIEENQP